LEDWFGAERSRKIEFQDFITREEVGGKEVSPTDRSPLATGNTTDTFLLEDEFTLGP